MFVRAHDVHPSGAHCPRPAECCAELPIKVHANDCSLPQVIFSLLRPGLFYLGSLPAGDQAEFTHTYDPRSSQVTKGAVLRC